MTKRFSDVKPQMRSQTEVEEHLRAELRKSRSDVNQLTKKLGNRKLLIAEVIGAVEERTHFKKHTPRARKKNRPDVGVVLKLSDWHIGEKIDPKQVEWMNEYNYQIACDRILGTIIPAFVKWVEGARTTFNIKKLWIFLEGDYVSGGIHKELQVTDEFPNTVATAKAGDLMIESVGSLVRWFEEIEVCAIGGGNHDRTDKKPTFKNRVQDSWGFLVHHIMRAGLRQYESVTLREAEGMKMLIDVMGWKFLCEHGDTIRSQMGIPYYGFQRAAGREAVRRMNSKDRGYHYLSIGHFHVPAVIENKWIVNGSLSGTTEFDHGLGRFAPPAQVAFMVGKNGMFNWVPFGEKS